MNERIQIDSFFLPRAGSTLARDVDFGWHLVTWVSAFFFVLIVTAMVVFVVRYRRRSEHDRTSAVDHSTTLEVAWTVIPFALVIVLFVVGFRGYVNAAVSPAEAFEIKVTAEKWRWLFSYPGGQTTMNELKVPVGKPVRLVMSSKDVVHSLFIPEFRIKQDVVPGTYTSLWFEATAPTRTVLLCTEYCGAAHSDMLASVHALPEAELEAWLDRGGDEALAANPVEAGQKLFTSSSCAGCHSTDGSPSTGPTLKGVFGHDVALASGQKVKAEENYLRESILDPAAKVVAGFQPVMPTYQGLLTEKQLDALVAYIKTLR